MSEERSEIPEEGIKWCKSLIPKFAPNLSSVSMNRHAAADYHLMADGIVWSDEYSSVLGTSDKDFNRFFSTLVFIRSSKILRIEGRPIVDELLDCLMEECQGWSFCCAERFDPALSELFHRLKIEAFNHLDRHF